MHILRWWHTVYFTRVQTPLKHGTYNTQSHLQQMHSNGQAECFVQTIKNSLIKAIEGGEDPHLAILTYVTTPLNHSLPSPAELLNSRRYRCILPVQIQQHNYTHQYGNIMQRQKQYQTKYYNRNARDLPSLKTGRPVYVQLVPKKQEIGHQDTSPRD